MATDVREPLRSGAAETGQAPATRRVYDRIAWLYDVIQAPMECMGGGTRRRRLLSRAEGTVLEIGIGTGLNLVHYPAEVALTGIDISPAMLKKAAARATALERTVHLREANVESLPYPDDSFDTVTATCVFCSVDDPVRGFREVRRVVKPDGRVLLLEHVRPEGAVLGWLFDRLAPITRRLIGPEINRRTEENVRAAGLEILNVGKSGIWREIEARAG
jgi:ubiquinone/menaquinone biosynthesis C-methylase UbiE